MDISLFQLTDTPLETMDLYQGLRRPEAGALVTFEGWVRNHNDGKTVTALEYEVFAGLCEKEGQNVLTEALERFDVLAARCVHRFGRLNIGEMAVWVGVCSAHRGVAFEACRHIIDEIKHRLPIWKKEYYPDGHSGWVSCEGCRHS